MRIVRLQYDKAGHYLARICCADFMGDMVCIYIYVHTRIRVAPRVVASTDAAIFLLTLVDSDSGRVALGGSLMRDG